MTSRLDDGPRRPGGRESDGRPARGRQRWGRPIAGLLLALPLAPTGASAQEAVGRAATRATCHRALASWTLGGRPDPAPFQARPALAALLPAEGPPTAPSRLELGVHGSTERGILRAGESIPKEDGFRYPGPTVLRRRTRAAALGVVRERLGPLALVADASLGESLKVATAQLGVHLGPVVLSGGRESPWPGHGCGGGFVLSGRGAADGAGVDTSWLEVPWLGTLAVSAFVGRLPEASTDNRHPLFLTQRVVWAAGEDVRVGLTRAALFGGEGTSVPVTLRTVGLMLLGVTDVEGKDSDFENQVASVDLSWRMSAGDDGIRLNVEYGADDSGFAFLRVPALSVGGAWVTPTTAGVRSLAADLAWIAPSTRAYPEWYRHGALAWGWTDRGVLLGHDLGGEGWGLRITGFAARGHDELEARLLVSRRGDENLLAPDARGWGVELRSEGRVGLGSWGRGRVMAAWHLDAGRLGAHGLLRLGLSGLYRF